MPIGELIGAAIGIMLLIIVAYLVVGSILVTSEITLSAQRDLAIQNEARLNTQMVISTKNIDHSTGKVSLTFNNTGSEIISDFSHMEIISSINCTPEPIIYNFSRNGNLDHWNSWNISQIYVISPTVGNLPESQHIGMLDPGEEMDVWFLVNLCPTPSPTNVYITFITNKGSTISTTVST